MSQIKISELPEIFSIPTTAVAAVSTAGDTFKIQKANMGFARLYVSATTPTGTRTDGDIWIDTSGTDPVFKTWDGTQWVTQTFSTTPGAGTVPIASLEDIASQRIIGRISASTGAVEVLTPAQARGVLELVAVAVSGSASDLTTGTLPDARLSTAVTTALGLANTAVQPGDLATVATTGDYDDLTNKPDYALDDFSNVDPTEGSIALNTSSAITMAGNLTLDANSPLNLALDPDGTDRLVTDATLQNNTRRTIKHVGSANIITIADETGNLTFLRPSESIIYQRMGGITRIIYKANTKASGGYYISATSETTIAAQNTPVKIAGTTTVITGAVGMDMPENNRLRNISGETKKFQVDYTSFIQDGGGTVDLGLILAKDGAPITGSKMVNQSTASKPAHIAGQWILDLADDEYVELFVENTTNDNNVTALYGTLTAHEI